LHFASEKGHITNYKREKQQDKVLHSTKRIFIRGSDFQHIKKQKLYCPCNCPDKEYRENYIIYNIQFACPLYEKHGNKKLYSREGYTGNRQYHQ
jgi:hypothetical protein